jgi:two-component system KDP operon response regulator KdpE
MTAVDGAGQGAIGHEPTILLIEDDPQVRRFLRISLGAHRFRTLEATTGEEALRIAAQYAPELVLLDLGLPDLDGVEVVKRLREWSTVPIVVLSAREREQDKVAALDAGADDYLVKPFGLAELLARLRVALRHRSLIGGEPNSVFEQGPLKVDLARRQVFVEGVEVRLTAIEYKLLAVLTRHAGKVVTSRQLIEEVWGMASAGKAHSLRVYMAHLRRKLEPRPEHRLFETAIGVGYRLLD